MTGKPLVVITGPTAVGKTKLAIAMCRTLNGEIINADSRQIYRHMDIGTAKPDTDEQRAAVHHLIDVVTPDENLSLAQFQRMAYAAIDDIHSRGRLPLLTGGTGQYISAVIEGWSIPEVPPNPALREELEAFASENGPLALHQRLAAMDTEAAQKIHPNNVRRIIRALEVYMETGTPITELQRKEPPPYRIWQYALDMDRDALYERADQRVDLMMEAGLLDEVRWLLANGYPASLPAMSGIGYKQLGAYLTGDVSLEQAIEDTKMITHDFIRRQYTWLRGHDTGLMWHNSPEMNPDELIEQTATWLRDTP
ncbi:MAG: tRNA (adenosine(37)-N6)-dimethylallyltransferase MiaA [Chloroflexota bacterium]